MCFSKVVVDVLLFYKQGLASWRVHPLKLAEKYILPLKHALIVIEGNSSNIRSQNVEYSKSSKSVK